MGLLMRQQGRAFPFASTKNTFHGAGHFFSTGSAYFIVAESWDSCQGNDS